jgi:hypothetical protein
VSIPARREVMRRVMSIDDIDEILGEYNSLRLRIDEVYGKSG